MSACVFVLVVSVILLICRILGVVVLSLSLFQFSPICCCCFFSYGYHHVNNYVGECNAMQYEGEMGYEYQMIMAVL